MFMKVWPGSHGASIPLRNVAGIGSKCGRRAELSGSATVGRMLDGPYQCLTVGVMASAGASTEGSPMGRPGEALRR